MKACILGSSCFNDKLLFKDSVKLMLCDIINDHFNKHNPIKEIITTTKGVFSNYISDFLSRNQYPVTLFDANYQRFGKAATYMRMKAMIEHCDVLYAFIPVISGRKVRSCGIKAACRYAKKLGKEVYLKCVDI